MKPNPLHVEVRDPPVAVERFIYLNQVKMNLAELAIYMGTTSWTTRNLFPGSC